MTEVVTTGFTDIRTITQQQAQSIQPQAQSIQPLADSVQRQEQTVSRLVGIAETRLARQ